MAFTSRFFFRARLVFPRKRSAGGQWKASRKVVGFNSGELSATNLLHFVDIWSLIRILLDIFVVITTKEVEQKLLVSKGTAEGLGRGSGSVLRPQPLPFLQEAASRSERPFDKEEDACVTLPMENSKNKMVCWGIKIFLTPWEHPMIFGLKSSPNEFVCNGKTPGRDFLHCFLRSDVAMCFLLNRCFFWFLLRWSDPAPSGWGVFWWFLSIRKP